MKINKSPWQVTAEQLFKGEYDIPDIPVKEMSDEEQERVKRFYGKFSDPVSVYAELSARIVDLSGSEQTNHMDAYKLMYEAYLFDNGAENAGHLALDGLVFVYNALSQDHEQFTDLTNCGII